MIIIAFQSTSIQLLDPVPDLFTMSLTTLAFHLSNIALNRTPLLLKLISWLPPVALQSPSVLLLPRPIRTYERHRRIGEFLENVLVLIILLQKDSEFIFKKQVVHIDLGKQVIVRHILRYHLSVKLPAYQLHLDDVFWLYETDNYGQTAPGLHELFAV